MLNEMRFGLLSKDSIKRFEGLSRPLLFKDNVVATELYVMKERLSLTLIVFVRVDSLCVRMSIGRMQCVLLSLSERTDMCTYIAQRILVP